MHRYFRYIKLVLTKNVMLLVMISSCISNTIIIFQENKYEHLYKEEKIKVEGIIVSHAIEKEYKDIYKLKVIKVNHSDLYEGTQIYIDIKKEKNLKYGDRIICEGEFSKGSEQRNYGGFDYRLYLKSIKIYGTLNVEACTKVSSNNVNLLEKSMDSIKVAINKNIEIILDVAYQEIVKGLILGDTTNLQEELKEKFQIANISHVLAVSGMHIIYIVVGVEFIFGRFLGKRNIKYLIILSLIFYMSITGFTSSIVRAGIMGILNMIAFLTYRKKDIWTSIGFSLLSILINNPYAITRSRTTIVLFGNDRNYYFQ